MNPKTPPIEDHPIAAVFPLMTSAEIDGLADDIKANGLKHNIVLYEGRILDGRNRYRAAGHAKVEPQFEQYTGDDPVGYVVSLNIHRRNLDASQRAMIAANLASMKAGAPCGNVHAAKGDSKNKPANLPVCLSQAQAAEKLGVSERIVRGAAVVQKHGTPELKEAVREGRASVSAAAAVAKLPAREQRIAVAGGSKGVTFAAQNGFADQTPEGKNVNAWIALDRALPRETLEAIEKGTIRIKDGELIELTKQPRDTIRKAVNLMHVNRWPLKRALRCIEQPIDAESRVSDLINLCIREGGKWSGLFNLNAFRITVEHANPESLKQ